jgi:hypothetical protein
MPQTDIDSATSSGLTSTMVDYSVTPETTDGATGEEEFSYQNANFSEYLGYYKNIPELKIAVDTKANWVMGNGFEADEPTTMLLASFKGNGKDSFNSILENMERTCYVAEDAYCEIIRDKDGVLVNLKPLDPSTIKVIYNSKGIIKRYEQTSKTSKQTTKTFKTDEIFVLSHNRMADEVHGISIIPAIKTIINMRNEAMSDWKRVMHRNVDPLWIIHLDTDDTAEINAFKAKYDAARVSGENLYVPKGVVVPELVTTATNASLNPLTWIAQLNDYFFQAVGVPQIIVGNAKEFTDASGKIVYLSYEQSVKGEQLHIEEQVLGQLNIEIALTFPASMQNELISERDKDIDMTASQPNDTSVDMEGKE